MKELGHQSFTKTVSSQSPSSRNESPLEYLRTATANRHTAVEQVANWNRSLSSVENYSRLLCAYEQVISPFEIAIDRQLNSVSVPPNYSPYARSQWLSDDKDVVFGDLAKQSERPALGCSEFPEIDSPNAAIGALYVLEGSSLGGQYLAKQLFKLLGYTAGRGGRFFAGYGAETGRHWKEFSNWANDQLANDVASAERSAIFAFDQFIAAFSGLDDE